MTKWGLPDWYIDPKRDDRYDVEQDGCAQAVPLLTLGEFLSRWHALARTGCHEYNDALARWADDGGAEP